MANPVGRGVRIAAGIALIASGLFAAFGFATVVLVAVGAVAFLAGAVNFCLLAPLLNNRVNGDRNRHRVRPRFGAQNLHAPRADRRYSQLWLLP
jgi:hypothetical protein